ncbi:MAG: 50S ribosomal protein L25 [Myxococcota bacterium]
MHTTTLKAHSRNETGKGAARRLRAAGKLPSIAYGKGRDAEALTVDRDALRKILLSERGRNHIIALEVEGGEAYNVMVKDYLVHPVSRGLLHADFVRIEGDRPVVCEVPFATTGKAKGVQAGGTLLSNMRSIKVRTIPSNIPVVIEHDVSDLEIDDVLKVGDLSLPEGVEALLPAERKLAMVSPPRVSGKAKADEEGAEGGDESAGDDEG